MGRVVDVSTLARPRVGMWMELSGSCAKLRVIHIDKFGNVVLSQRFEELAKALALSIGSVVEVRTQSSRALARVARVFSEVGKGELVLYRDSFDLAELAINLGSARDALGVDRGCVVEVCRVEGS